jgi:hypothetical protein
MGVDGLALASTLSILIYTAALAVLWYGRTGWEHARPVAATTLRSGLVAVAAGFAAWGAAEWLLGRFEVAGFLPSLLAVAAGAIVLLAIGAASPWMRRDLTS